MANRVMRGSEERGRAKRSADTRSFDDDDSWITFLRSDRNGTLDAFHLNASIGASLRPFPYFHYLSSPLHCFQCNATRFQTHAHTFPLGASKRFPFFLPEITTEDRNFPSSSNLHPPTQAEAILRKRPGASGELARYRTKSIKWERKCGDGEGEGREEERVVWTDLVEISSWKKKNKNSRTNRIIAEQHSKYAKNWPKSGLLMAEIGRFKSETCYRRQPWGLRRG